MQILANRDVEILSPLKVLTDAQFTGDITQSSTTAIQGGSVVNRVTQSGDGYVSQFMNSTYSNEEGQIWIGRGYGFNMRTNTDSPISFQTGGYTTQTSMKILGSGNRDVEIYTPLNIKGSSTTIDQSVSIGGTLTITGALTTTAFYSIKPYVAAYVILSALSTTVKPGFITPTLAKTSGQYIFTLPTPHPSGAHYTVFVQQRMSAQTSAQAFYGVLVNSSTSFTVWSKTNSNAAIDSDFYVHTVP
jgi:hypothetical protein